MELKNGTIITLEIRDNLPPQVIICYPSKAIAKESYEQMVKTYIKLHIVTKIED